MPDFTQGKWEAQNWDADRYAVFDETGITVADCFNNEANARLISAAPEMYWIFYNLLFELKRGNGANPQYIEQVIPTLEDLLKRINQEDANA